MNDKRYIHPLERITKALEKVRKIRKQVYSLMVSREAAKQMNAELIPALTTTLEWAREQVAEEHARQVKSGFAMALEEVWDTNAALEKILASDFKDLHNLSGALDERAELLKAMKETDQLLTKLGVKEHEE